MDEEQTGGYREPCALCSAVDWAVSDEGRFYCKSCHNVIERSTEVDDMTITDGSSRITKLCRGIKSKKPERERQWVVCEGFQFILKNQAEALVRLGVSPRFKDEVLCQMWRIYLQKSRQAFTNNPARTSSFRVRGLDSDSDSAAESVMSAGDQNQNQNPSSAAASSAGSSSDWSECSGSLDAFSYLSTRLRRSRRSLMTMKKTLALIHLALVWSCEPLTLSDLLRLVNEGHVPYVNAYQELPDEMKLYGKDSLIFRVESVPPHRVVHREAQTLLLQLQLPAFPPISRQSLLHPSLLSLRYLTEANLPDELHSWVCRLMEGAGMADQSFLTVDPSSRPILPRYDVQTAALIIVTMKLVFGLDDHAEWVFSNEAGDQDDTGAVFSLRRWFKLLDAALIRGQLRRRQGTARKQWTAQKPLYSDRKLKWSVMKRKRTAEQIHICFRKLSSQPADVELAAPSSFQFCWGDEDGSDGPSLNHQSLGGVTILKDGVQTLRHSTYWRPAFRARKMCSHVYSQLEDQLPQMFVWLLRLFCFLLDVKPAYLMEEVLRVERQVIGRRTRTRTRAQQRQEVGETR